MIYGQLRRGLRAVGVVAAMLCAVVFWPGVVSQANLDAKPVNALAAIGVLLTLALTIAVARSGGVSRMSRRRGDIARIVIAVVLLVVVAPWVAADLGFFLNGVPVLGSIFHTARPTPGVVPYLPTVHHGHHHGMDGYLLVLTALLLSRTLGEVRQRGLRRVDGVPRAHALLRPRQHRQRPLDRAGLEARLGELADSQRARAAADRRLGGAPRCGRRDLDRREAHRVKKRLDVLLVERGLAESRAQAQALVLAGLVPGYRRRAPRSTRSAELTVEAPPRFVSRGGEKLANALDAVGLDVAGLDCLDLGASTGGFTDCLLQRGAARVVAVDVGYGQLHPKLRGDPRVTVLERTNARALEELPFAPALVVCDVSFISARTVLPPALALAAPGLARARPRQAAVRGGPGRRGQGRRRARPRGAPARRARGGRGGPRLAGPGRRRRRLRCAGAEREPGDLPPPRPRERAALDPDLEDWIDDAVA